MLHREPNDHDYAPKKRCRSFRGVESFRKQNVAYNITGNNMIQPPSWRYATAKKPQFYTGSTVKNATVNLLPHRSHIKRAMYLDKRLSH